MKINYLFGLVILSLILSTAGANAQNFQTMPVQSGYNADVIANGVGSSMVSTTTDVDGVSFAFVATDFQLSSSSTPITYGIPVNGTINSVAGSTPGLSFQLGNLSGMNSLKLPATGNSGTLVFATPKAAFKLYLLSTSGSGTSSVSATVTFADNSTQVFTSIALSDWYGGSNYAIQGIGRINRTNDVLEPNSTNPRMYQSVLDIDAANQTKPIQSITFTKTIGTGIPNIFAVSADAFTDCSAPTLQPVGTLSPSSAQVSWTVPATTTAASYDLYYSTTNTPPTSSTIPNMTGITGTSTTIGSLSASTTYYYWVRTNCSTVTGQSTWSFAGNFKTLCGPIASMFENFDSYSTGSTVPDCWDRIITTNGSQTISSTSPASGTRNIYQYSSASQNPTIVVLPSFSNVNAGTHWLRFKARVSSATGTLNVGYVTSATDASSFVLLQALNISNTTYGANSEYTVIVPSSVPANARLAIKNTADTKSYYWDDVSWETIPTCFAPTAVTASNITQNSADVSWTAPSSAPSGGYEYYYSTTNTDPVAATVPSGSTAASVVSASLSSLNPNTTYYVWVRSVCSTTDKSAWSFVASFKTLCGTMTTMFENFDSYSTGSIVPDCWERLAGSGSQTISSTGPASGTRNIYQYTSSASTPTLAVLPSFSNITAGTHRLRLKARVTSGTGVLSVGYVTNPTDASTFVLIQDLSITNTSYTATNAEYTITVPASIPANARLAIHCAKDGKSYYWDDIYWEDANLSTSEVEGKKNLSIYPNPFSDVLFISEIENVKSIKIYDLSGKVVKVIDSPSKEINLSSLKSGLYMVTMFFKDGSQSAIKAIKK